MPKMCLLIFQVVLVCVPVRHVIGQNAGTNHLTQAEITEAVDSARAKLQELGSEQRLQFLVVALSDPKLFSFAEKQLEDAGPAAYPALRRASLDRKERHSVRARALSFLSQHGDSEVLKGIKADDPLILWQTTAYEQVHAPEVLEFQLAYIALKVRGLPPEDKKKQLSDLEMRHPSLRYSIALSVPEAPKK
jgi:hypothetical protein